MTKSKLFWFSVVKETLVKNIASVIFIITTAITISPSFGKDVAKVMDGLYNYVPQWIWGIISIIIFLGLVVWNYLEYLSKAENETMLLEALNENESITPTNLQDNRNGGVGFQNSVFHGPVTISPQENKKDSVEEVKIKIFEEKDSVQKDYIFKQVRLISQISQKLLSCYATADFYIVPEIGDRETILPQSNELLWASAINNRMNLVEGLPARLYIARINSKKRCAELVGTNNYCVPIEKGTYLAIIRFDGDNFSPKSFRVTFYYDGKKSIEFKDISGLSNILFAYTEGSRK